MAKDVYFHKGKQIEPKYIYDNGFGERIYHCLNCDSHELIQKPLGGFQPPEYHCDNCTQVSHAPKWTKLEVL